ncbi:MAG: GGDEF domain-containing protein, partial [Thermodesulfobacteriota bacterium]
MPRTDQKLLLQELEELRLAILRQQKQETGHEAKQGIAVFRTYQDLDWEDWYRFNWHQEFSPWIAMPLNGSLSPALQEIQNKIQNLARLSQLDPLTGLANRRSLEQSLELESERSRRHGQPLSLALLDIDDFKQLNDTYGHSLGDQALVELSRLLRNSIRKTDMAARLGGEEFVLLLPGTGLIQAKHMLNRIMDRLRKLKLQVSSTSDQIAFTCSIGMVCYKGRLEIQPAQILEAADQAMYQAKI